MNQPKETFPGFIYLDLCHPLVAWECYRGTLISSYQDASNETQNTSLRMANIISSGNNITLANELLFEHVRAQYFPTAVSRLKCLYVFGDKPSAEAAIQWGDPFIARNLVDVGVGANKVTKVDANWVTFAKRDKNELITEDYIPHIKDYWSGKPFNDKPHWEFLVDGYAIIWGTEHKQQAYQIVKRIMPDTLGLLEISRIAEGMGYYLGHIYPQISRISQTSFKLNFIIDAHDLNDNYGNFIESFEKYKGPINLQDFKKLFYEDGKIGFTVPDLREYMKEFLLSNETLYGLSSLKIHNP